MKHGKLRRYDGFDFSCFSFVQFDTFGGTWGVYFMGKNPHSPIFFNQTRHNSKSDLTPLSNVSLCE